MRFKTKIKFLSAFTLIELLCVVGVIAILAAIAVPNFLEAHVRSKIARVKQDQAFIAAALEAYFCDYKMYPVVPPMVDFPEKKSITEGEFADFIARSKIKTETPQQFRVPTRVEGLFIQSDFGNMENLRTDDAPLYVLLKFFQTKSKILNKAKKTPVTPDSISSPSQSVIPPEPQIQLDEFYQVPYQYKSYEYFAAQFASHSFQVLNQKINYPTLYSLTTPIAYIHSENLQDVFQYRWQRTFFYVNYNQFQAGGLWIPFLQRNMMYALISFGPDIELDYINVAEPLYETYDPTNGTVSGGDIIRWSEIYSY